MSWTLSSLLSCADSFPQAVSRLSSSGSQSTALSCRRRVVHGIQPRSLCVEGCCARRVVFLLTHCAAICQEGAAWAKDKDVQEATAKGDWLGKGLS